MDVTNFDRTSFGTNGISFNNSIISLPFLFLLSLSLPPDDDDDDEEEEEEAIGSINDDDRVRLLISELLLFNICRDDDVVVTEQ